MRTIKKKYGLYTFLIVFLSLFGCTASVLGVLDPGGGGGQTYYYYATSYTKELGYNIDGVLGDTRTNNEIYFAVRCVYIPTYVPFPFGGGMFVWSYFASLKFYFSNPIVQYLEVDLGPPNPLGYNLLYRFTVKHSNGNEQTFIKDDYGYHGIYLGGHKTVSYVLVELFVDQITAPPEFWLALDMIKLRS